MRVILVAVAVIVALAGRSGHAEDFSAAAPPGSISGQDPQEPGGTGLEQKSTGWLNLTRGTRVRLMVEDGGPMRQVAGRLVSSDASTVTVDTDGGPHRFSRDKLFHLSYRTHGNRMKGLALAAAGVVGMAVCLQAYEQELDRTLGESRGNGQGAGLLCVTPGLGAIGFGIHMTRGEWNHVKPDGLTVTGAATPRRATVALRPARRGAGLTLALSF